MSDRERTPRWWQRLNQAVPASRPGAWVCAQMLHHLDRPLLRLSKGRFSFPTLVAGLPVILVTTVGAKRSVPHTVPLVGLQDGEKVILIASNWGRARHPGWYHNLRAHPTATLQIDGRTADYEARLATDAEREYYWHRATTVYRGFAAYARRAGDRRIPIVVLTPRSSALKEGMVEAREGGRRDGP